MYEVLISDGTIRSSLFSIYLMGHGTAWSGRLPCKEKTDEFDSRVLHHPNFGTKQVNVSPIILIYNIR